MESEVARTISSARSWNDQLANSLDIGSNWTNVSEEVKVAIVAASKANMSALQVVCSIDSAAKAIQVVTFVFVL